MLSQIGKQLYDLFFNLFNRPTISDVVDVLLVSFAIYQLLLLTRRTRADQVLKGVGIILVAAFFSSSKILNLKAINFILNQIISSGALVAVVLFQPEIRSALERLGRGALLSTPISNKNNDASWVPDEIITALLHLSSRKVGALVVVEKKTALGEIMKSGTVVDGFISSGLLENIFEPNTPLHDGAVVLRGRRIAAAGCLLTLSDDTQISKELGTRHRAALGTSESTDAITLIVSEETGIISMAREGKLTRYMDRVSLTRVLSEIYGQQDEHEPLILRLRKKVKK